MSSEKRKSDLIKADKVCTNVDSQIFENFKQTINTRRVTNKHPIYHIEEAMKIWIEKQQERHVN